MRLDVQTLGRFYAKGLGGVAHTMIARRLAAAWPTVAGLDVLGLGYARPFLDPWRATARRVIAAMPAAQGVERWPAQGPAAAVLSEETRLPFCEALFDRALLVHALEETEALAPTLRELWRVCAPEARVIIVAASRRGLWSRLETSPFGHGRSFTRAQLATVLQGSMWEPVAWSRALYAPPAPWPFVTHAADAWEKAGERFWPRLGGVILVEAVKRVVASTPKTARQMVFAPAPALRPLRRDGLDRGPVAADDKAKT